MRSFVGAQVYVVVYCDSHVDDDLSVYASETSAVQRAEEYRREALRHYCYGVQEDDVGLTDSMRAIGWVYYARVGEDCSVRVERKDVW